MSLFDWFSNKRRLLTNPELLGEWGQKQSEKFLKKKGLKLLARNFSCKTGEIDLIMVDTDGAIVFVEVKTRADSSFAQPESSVNYPKRTRMIKAANFFISNYKIDDRPFRFDIITAVLSSDEPVKIEHYPSAFVPD